jgi:hypothetical protein
MGFEPTTPTLARLWEAEQTRIELSGRQGTASRLGKCAGSSTHAGSVARISECDPQGHAGTFRSRLIGRD